jgi:hypothetical protein
MTRYPAGRSRRPAQFGNPPLDKLSRSRLEATPGMSQSHHEGRVSGCQASASTSFRIPPWTSPATVCTVPVWSRGETCFGATWQVDGSNGESLALARARQVYNLSPGSDRRLQTSSLCCRFVVVRSAPGEYSAVTAFLILSVALVPESEAPCGPILEAAHDRAERTISNSTEP